VAPNTNTDVTLTEAKQDVLKSAKTTVTMRSSTTLQNTDQINNFNPHPHFGKGKHKVNPDAVNHELRRKLWDGQLPIKVTLYDKEISKINR